MKKGKTNPSVLVFGILVLLFLFALVYAVRIRSVDSLVILALAFAACWASVGSIAGESEKQQKALLDRHAAFLLHEIELAYERVDELFNSQHDGLGAPLGIEPVREYWKRLSGVVHFKREALDLLTTAGEIKHEALRKYAKCLFRCYDVWDAQLSNRLNYIARMQSDMAGKTVFQPSWYDETIKRDEKIADDLDACIDDLKKYVTVKELL